MKSVVKKTIVYLLLFGVGLIGRSVWASEWPSSRNQTGPVADSSVFGAKSSTTETTARILVSSSMAMVYGLHLSSQIATSYLVVVDTDIVSQTGNFVAGSTVTTAQFSATADRFIQFNPPLRLRFGLMTYVAGGGATACQNANSPGQCYTVVYDSTP